MQKVFLEPKNATHRQYEALRAYFVDEVPSQEVAVAFGYTTNSFRVLCSNFKNDHDREFFLPPQKGPQTERKSDPVREKVIELRKQNLSVYDIRDQLIHEGTEISAVSISKILVEEGFSKLPRRKDEDLPSVLKPEKADVADIRQLDLSSRSFKTKFGGLFLFMPYLAQLGMDSLLEQAKFPGSNMIPAASAMRSLLALKLAGNARHSRIMGYVFDEGLSLFAGLNCIPKRSFLTEYSCRVDPRSAASLMPLWFDRISALGLEHGSSFNLDFHTIPFHGEDALIEKHYLSKRSRRQKGILAFLAQDGDKRFFCYANATIRKGEENDEIFRFVDYWKQRTGNLPPELIFDSKLTTHENLDRLNKMDIAFITLRRRGGKILESIYDEPLSAWRKISLDGVSRIYKTPRIIDRKIILPGYEGEVRQLIIKDLGHEEPTLLLTNQIKRSAKHLIERYAKRMLIENSIADGIDFFHMDALSSTVALKIDCDLQLTLMGSSLYRLLGQKIGHGFETAKSTTIFEKLPDATARVEIDPQYITVKYQKRAYNPLLMAADFHSLETPIPWLDGRILRFQFG